MKILQINSHYNQSGAGKIVGAIHDYLREQGHESRVAFGRGKRSHDRDTYFISTKLSIYFSVFVNRFIGINGFTSWLNTKKLVQEISRFKPDVIHLHGLHGYYVNFAILFDYINRNEIPVVWTFHDCHAFTGNCGYSKDCYKWESGCGGCPYLNDYPTTYLFDFTKQMWKKKRELFTTTDTKIIVSPSDWMTKNARKSYFKKYQCITINNGIDTERVFFDQGKEKCRIEHGYKSEDKIILGIAFGLDNPRKGVKYMIQLARDLYDEGIKLILIGWNSKNDHLIDGLDNIETIAFTNNQAELAEYYSLADVFLLPSLDENYATVTLESLACGTPVVGFNVGGIPEQLSNGNGIVVEKENQKEFNKAVMDILNGNANLNSKELIIENTKINNSIYSMASKYEKEYFKIVDKKRSK